MRRCRTLILTCVALVVAMPTPASAVLSIGTVTGPGSMTMTHSIAGASTWTVAISAGVLESWTVKIVDNGSTTPGRMDRVDCSSRAALGGSLSQALEWSTLTSGGSLSDTPATVASGIGPLGAIAIGFRQPIGNSDAVASGACYQLTATVTIS